MGRPGRSSGGGRRSGSSSRSRSSSSRSHSSSRSSFRSSGSSRSSSFSRTSAPSRVSRPPRGPRGYRPAPPPRGPRYSYTYRNYRPMGCLDTIQRGFATIIILVVLFTMLFTMSSFSNMRKQYSSNVIDTDVVYEQAQQFYSNNFDDENHMLLFYTYLEDSESDDAYLVVGDDAFEVFNTNVQDEFWDIYEDYYVSDVSEAEWLANTFRDMGRELSLTQAPAANFNETCYEDKIGWINNSDKNVLVTGLKEFYTLTGIQPYIVLINYEDLPGVVISTGNNSTVLKTFIIAVAVIVVLVLLINWWKKVQQSKKEEAETTERMLNTPLESFGDTNNKELNDLIDKYDDN